MKAVILNGALPGDDAVDTAGRGITTDLKKHGWQVQHLPLREMKIGYCLGCFQCWTHTPGLCRINDDGREVARQLIQSDLAILLTPLTFGGYSSELKKTVDRNICLISPFFMKIDDEVHHRPRYKNFPAMLGIAISTQPNGNQAQTFARLVERNAINMHAPVQGALVFQSHDDGSTISSALHAFLETNMVKA